MKLFPGMKKMVICSACVCLSAAAISQSIIRQGFNAVNIREYVIAYKNFTNAVQTWPDSAYYGLGLMEEYYKLDTNKAVNDFEVSVKLDPRYAPACKELARIKYKKRNYYGALMYCNQALVSDSNNSGAYNIRGKTYYAMGSYAQSVNDFTHAIQLSPNFAEAYLYRSIAEKALHQYIYAMADISRSVELQPGFYNYYFQDGENTRELLHVNDTVYLDMEKSMNMYYVPVNVDGLKEWFMLDFGCDALSIPQRMNDELQRNGTLDDDHDFIKNAKRYDITSNNYDVKEESLKTVRIGNQVMFNVPVAVEKSEHAPSLFGMEILKRFGKVIIDNDNQVLTLIRYRQKDYETQRYTQPIDDARFVNRPTMPLAVKKLKCTLKAEINGEQANMIFDTGAYNLCISEDFVNYLKLQGKISDADYVRETNTTGASGNIVSGSYIRLKSIKVGGQEFTNIDALVVHTEYNGLLLGQTILQKFRKITVDFVNSQISFE